MDILSDGASEVDETLTVTLDSAGSNAALSPSIRADVLITSQRLPPEVTLSVLQAARTSLEVYQGEGNVAVTATPVYGQTGLTYDWSASDVTIIGTGNSVSFDPDAESIGLHNLAVAVFDGTTSVRQQLGVRIVASLPTLGTDDSDGDGINDLTEGLGDSDLDGIPDYLDAVPGGNTQQRRASTTGVVAAELVTVTPGLTLRVGAHALGASRAGIGVIAPDIVDAAGDVIEDDTYSVIGGLFDFEISGLNPALREAQVVLPLSVTLPVGAQYRKLHSGEWGNFVEGPADAVHSAFRVNGECPDRASADWLPALVAGTSCVRLTLSDGGPNDTDGEVNGVIRDPGGAGIVSDPPPAPVVPSDKANSGSVSLGWLVWLMVLAGLRWSVRRNGSRRAG